jgi:hypothetical protein
MIASKYSTIRRRLTGQKGFEFRLPEIAGNDVVDLERTLATA